MKENKYKARLAMLRTVMERRNIDAYVVPVTDPHLGEYVPEHWRIIAWLSGFSGSAATMVVTRKFAGLWTDSRYFLQAGEQLKESGVELMKLRIPHTPEYISWLASSMKPGMRVGVDGRIISIGQARLLKEALSVKGIALSIHSDLISGIWDDRPLMPSGQCFEHTIEYAGISRREKIDKLNATLKDNGADYQLLTAIDDIMWLLNIRGNDISTTPLLTSFALAGNGQVLLFTDEEKVPFSLRTALDRDSVVILPYDTLTWVLSSLPGDATICLSPATTSASIFHSIPKKMNIVEDVSIVSRLKAIKNEIEISNIRKVMIKDGVALTRFFIWLFDNAGKQSVTELSASARLEQFRSEQEGFVSPSFNTIAAFNEHAALPHYSPSASTDTAIDDHGIFLLDSGGQYFGGTTDTTRTVALGVPSQKMKRDFTLALKGTIALAMAKFPYGTRGYQIEMLARQALWNNGLNYGHGTGHGVGYFLNVHEGPQTIGSAASGDMKTFIEPGMLTSDEPAVYREGEYGFRTENLILCVDDMTTDYGRFLKFETVTLCYIDQSLLDIPLLSAGELEWLNNYHKEVFEKLSPELNDSEREWLREKTKKIIN